ncbi:MAG TPA: preprotein translocase subunit YajC [Bacteroidales bacterium]|jgi:preprotein translocase subunit YajC|nr:preprotein translocase subunit YajC [Bacteroidales bacterium]HPS72400.1 preprotein translocase subunit YajC [Bacteroidales bacterium]
MNIQSILLFAQPAANGAKGGSGYSMLIFLGLMILVFYFFMIRPQQKKQKQVQQFRENLKKGDKVVTIGGIHGKITDVQEGTFTIEIADNVKITIEKAAVAIDGNDTKK